MPRAWSAVASEAGESKPRLVLQARITDGHLGGECDLPQLTDVPQHGVSRPRRHVVSVVLADIGPLGRRDAAKSEVINGDGHKVPLGWPEGKALQVEHDRSIRGHHDVAAPRVAVNGANTSTRCEVDVALLQLVESLAKPCPGR